MLADDDVLGIIIACAPLFLKQEPVPQHTSILTGSLYYKELMATNSVARFRTVARMDKETFIRLLLLLRNEGGLQSSKKMEAGEKVMMFIHSIVGFSVRQIAERWQHSSSTISTVIHEVAQCFMSLKGRFFVDPEHEDVPVEISSNSRYSPFFNGCIGALDRSHIPAVVPIDDKLLFEIEIVFQLADLNLLSVKLPL